MSKQSQSSAAKAQFSTVVSKPNAVIEVRRINLTENEKQRLSTGGAHIPAPVVEPKKQS